MVEYLIPNSLDEVLKFIDTHSAKIVSGATDLMVQKRNWAELPATFDKAPVYIFNLEELKYIKKENNNLHIGACTPLSDILVHPDTPSLLKDSISIIASPALRNLATLPGNIMNASPAGDTLPILYVLDAAVVVRSKSGSYIVSVDEVITGPRKTTLAENEIITEVIIPLEMFTSSQFIKVGGRKADAISKISFTSAISIKDKTVTDLRLAFGAVGPVVVRHKEIESKYINMTVTEFKDKQLELIEEYSEYIRPIDDQRSNKEYRKQVALNLLKDFLKHIK